MLTRTATPKKQIPPTTPANTGWGRRPGSCVREGYTSRPGQRDKKESQWADNPHIPSDIFHPSRTGFSPEVEMLAMLLGSLT